MGKKIATVIIMAIMFSVFILDIITVALCNKYEDKYTLAVETKVLDDGRERLHFLNVGNSDAILIESNGHFALIDSGEGSKNPRENARIDGFEDLVISYLKRVAGDKNGKVVLDFILATHYHYDHVGCFDSIIRNSDITIKRAYFKAFSTTRAKPYEIKTWKLDVLYSTLIDDLNSRNIEIVSDIPSEPFKLGDFTVQFFNTSVDLSEISVGENDNCVGAKLTKGNFTAFLAADITSTNGLEERLAPLIGEVDLLKLGHHGYALASTGSFVKLLNPKIAIVTNELGKIYPNVKWNLTMIAHASTYSTVKENGVIATIDDNGEVSLTKDIHH